MTLVAGTPDIGGSRASLAMMAAEELGIALEKVRPLIGDTSALGLQLSHRRQPRNVLERHGCHRGGA